MKLLVITGATGGIGGAMARLAMERGYQVVGLARTVPDESDFPVHSVDVSDARAVARFFATMRGRDLWGVINAAGAAAMNLALTTPSTTFARLVEINLLGAMYCGVEAARAFARNRSAGRIINFSTIAVALGLAGESAYAASKAGVEAFTRCFARETAGLGITVNAVAPGPMDTRLLAGVGEDKIQKIVERQIVPRRFKPEDVWPVVEWLLKEESSMISGEVLHIGGV